MDDDDAFVRGESAEPCRSGWGVTTATRAQDALIALQREAASLVVLEPLVPGGSWPHLLRGLAATGARRLVIATSFHSNALREHVRQFRPWAYLRKPIAPDALVSAALATERPPEESRPPETRPHTTLAYAEWELLNAALVACNGSVARTAATLGISRQSFYNKLRKRPTQTHTGRTTM